MSSLLGTTLGGRYRLESRIAAGGMSTVYRAHDETLERWVAIKVMNREIAEDSDQLERFRREAKAVARLSHPNVVHVIDAGEDAGHPYIVFEYVDGETLKERIRRLGRLDIAEAVAYAVEIARALGAAHANRMVHRDVKPQNVLIDHDGTAKVTDFGIARTLEEHGLTDDGRVLGTTDYVSPEQALGKRATGQADLYSLGVVLYEMLTGELPFKADTQVAVAMKHVREPMPDVRRSRPEVSATLAAVIETATAKELSERYGSDAEMIAELENVLALEASRAGTADGEVTAVLDTLPADVRRRVPLAVRHRRALLVAIGLGIALVVAAVVVLTLAASPNRGRRSHPVTPTRLQAVRLCSSCAYAYNPYGLGGTSQDNAEAPLAINGQPRSPGWSTQDYYSGQLGKPGVGIYVAASTAVAARRLVLTTATPGYSTTIFGSRTPPNQTNFRASHWMPLASAADTLAEQSFALSPGRHGYKYYLVWITKLPPPTGPAPSGDYATVNQIRLFR